VTCKVQNFRVLENRSIEVCRLFSLPVEPQERSDFLHIVLLCYPRSSSREMNSEIAILREAKDLLLAVKCRSVARSGGHILPECQAAFSSAFSQLIIHGMPNRSVSIPKRTAQNVSPI